MKLRKQKIASRHIEKLLSLAVDEARTDTAIAEEQANNAWKIATRFNIRLKEKRFFFCRFCKKFIMPPLSSRVRLSRRRKSINITCLKCGRTYHRIFQRLNTASEKRL